MRSASPPTEMPRSSFKSQRSMNRCCDSVPNCIATYTSVQPAIGISEGSPASIASAAFSERGLSSESALMLTGTGFPQRRFHRAKDGRVARASAQIPRESGLDLELGRTSLQRYCGENHPRCADAALRAAVLDKCILQRLADPGRARALDGYDATAFSVRPRRDAR